MRGRISLMLFMLIALAMLAAALIGINTPVNMGRYHVWCYTQSGQLVISRIVVQRPFGVWADESTGGKVILPDSSAAACAWLGLPNE